MGIGWIVLLICHLVGGVLFFSVNAVALRIFSRVKLHDAFEASNTKDLTDNLVQDAENRIWTCILYRLALNICILLLLLAGFSAGRPNPQITDYLFAFIIAMAIFLVFSLAVPHAWAKYAGEKVISRTYRSLMFFATVAWPVLCILKFTDGIVR